MAQATWEKKQAVEEQLGKRSKSNRLKFMIGGLMILGAVVYLIVSGTATGARYFITVDDVTTNAEYAGQTVRISGAVLGDTIEYDAETLTINFDIVHIPEEFDNLAEALHDAVNNENATRLSVEVANEPMPDLLQHEAQAILTGQLAPDGTFYATELLLKCPSRFEEAGPDQSIGQPVDHSDEYREAYGDAG